MACRQIRAKRELVRLMCGADGGMEIDAVGKKDGRGVYLCPVAGCWRMGLKGSRLEHALRTSLTQDNREQLIKYGQNLPEEGASGKGK